MFTLVAAIADFLSYYDHRLMNKRLLLLVDDNPDEAFLLNRALAKGGLTHWRIQSLPGGPVALEYLRRTQAGRVPLPDLLVLDVKMAPLGGLQLLKRVTEELPALPAVILTSAESLPDKLRTIDLGGRGYFVKSSTFADFVEFLRTFELGRAAVAQSACGLPA